jgi:hypothetical protein
MALPMVAMLATGAKAQTIQVQVNGNPVSFESTGPIERNDTVLVPLRGVFEALGASVDYDSSSQTVHAYRGGQEVALTIGSSQATVGGQTVALSQPATIVGGSTMVPLRFVAESLGAHVDWEADNNTVAIRTGGDVAEATPSSSVIIGTVVSVGRLDDGTRIIKLDDGQTVTLASNLRITMNGRDIGLDDIQPYDRVAIRVSTDENRGYRISVNPGTSPGPDRAPEAIGMGLPPQILTPEDGAVVGDHVTLTGRAYPGATVRLAVRYAGRSNGGAIAINGTQQTRDITADGDGNWSTSIHLAAIADNLDGGTVHYTIEARTVGAGGNLSPTESISVAGGHVYAHRRL